MTNTYKWAPYVLTALRVITVLLFFEHATMKFFEFPAPIPGMSSLPPLLLFAGAIEVLTSILMLVGLYTQVAALIASGEMAAAYFMAHAPQSFWPVLNMGEVAILFCFVFLYISFAGPGRFALDNRVKKRAAAASIA